MLAKAVAYVEIYERDLSAIVAWEEYLQRVLAADTVPQQRRLRADFLMVRLRPADLGVPFRDVFEVNGTPVHGRDARLQKLFLETPEASVVEARRITEENAPYNIGKIRRNINVPTRNLQWQGGSM